MALAVAGCGTDSTTSSDSGPTTSSNVPSDSTAGTTTGSNSLDKLLAKAKSANVKVTYTTSSSSDEFTMIQYNGDSVIISGTSMFASLGGKSYSCTTGDTPECLQLPGAANLAQTMTTGFFGLYMALFTAGQGANNPFLHVEPYERRDHRRPFGQVRNPSSRRADGSDGDDHGLHRCGDRRVPQGRFGRQRQHRRDRGHRLRAIHRRRPEAPRRTPGDPGNRRLSDSSHQLRAPGCDVRFVDRQTCCPNRHTVLVCGGAATGAAMPILVTVAWVTFAFGCGSGNAKPGGVASVAGPSTLTGSELQFGASATLTDRSSCNPMWSCSPVAPTPSGR